MPVTSDSQIRVEIKSIPSARVVALRSVVANYQSQGPLWAKVSALLTSQSLPRAGPCFAIFYDPGYKESDVDTEVCQPIAEDASVADDTKDVQVYHTPALPRVVSVTHEGPYSTLTGTYNQLFAWIHSQGETVNGPVREIYHVGVDKYGGDDSKLVTEIVVPLD